MYLTADLGSSFLNFRMYTSMRAMGSGSVRPIVSIDLGISGEIRRRWDGGLTDDTLAKIFVEIRHRELGAVGLDFPPSFLISVCCGPVAQDFRHALCQRVLVFILHAVMVGELENADSLLVLRRRRTVVLERVVRVFGT